jgi:TonB family protein
MSLGRFLRIGLVREGQVLEERLVAMGVDVTLGKAPGNMFIVADAKIPKSTVLFKARGNDRHALMFAQPQGRVDLGGGEPATLADLVKQGVAEKKDKTYVLPLPATARGKFEVGDVTVLFHYVDRDLSIVPNKAGPRPMVLEIVLSWGDTVLESKSFSPLRPVTIGPTPDCDLQLPGKILESRAYSLIAGADGRFYVDLRNPKFEVEHFEVEGKEEEPPAERLPIKGAPFVLGLALGDGFTLDLRYAQALARPASSPFDIQDPQPILTLAGSAVFHAIIMLIAFTVGESLLGAGEVKAAKAEARREIRAMLQEQQKKEEKKEAEKVADKKKDDKKEEVAKKEEVKKEEVKKAEPRPAASVDAKPAAAVAARDTMSPEDRRTKVTKDVRAKTFLNTLGGEGENGGGPVAAAKSTQFASAFDDVNAPYASNGGEGSPVGAGPKAEGSAEGKDRYKTLSAGETGGDRIATQNVKTSDKGEGEEAAIKVNVRTGSLGAEGGLGKIDSDAVAQVFSRRKGAIKACYEKELRRNQKLSGRITIRFTIGTAGRITNINASQNTTGDDAIASCIIDKVQGWKFDPPSGGAVTFTYPFILEAR